MSRQKARFWLFIGTIVLSVVLAYANTLQVPFHFDDVHYVTENPMTKDGARLLTGWRGSRSFTFATFWLNARSAGFQPWIFHVTNILIHVASSILVFLLIRLFLDMTFPDKSDDRLSWIALFCALLFGLHPMQTMAVTYISQRLASLAGLLYLSSVYCYLSGRLRGRGGYYAAALVLCMLAMKSKEMTFTLPLMIFLTEYAYFRESPHRPWYVLSAFALSLLIIPLSNIDSIWAPQYHSIIGHTADPTTKISRGHYFFTEMRVLMTYLGLLVFPVGQNIYYDYPLSRSFLEPAVLYSALFHATLTVIAIIFIRKSGFYRSLGMGILWWYIALSVESSIIPLPNVIDEYRVYLPVFGLLLVLATLLAQFVPRERYFRQLVVAGISLSLILGTLTFARNFVWGTEVSLWEDTVRKSPQKALPHNNLGFAYVKMQRTDKAVEQFRVALQLEPDSEEANFNLGNFYLKQGLMDEAIRYYLIALSKYPDDTDVHTNLGMAYQAKGWTDKAIEQFQLVYQKEPYNAEASYNLAIAYQDKGLLGKASEYYRMVLKVQPDRAEVYNNLGIISDSQGRTDEAIKHYLRAIVLKPEFAEARFNLGLAYHAQGDIARARSEFEKGLQQDPGNAEARLMLDQISNQRPNQRR